MRITSHRRAVNKRPMLLKPTLSEGSKHSASGPQSVARVLGILELLALRPTGESLTNISHALHAPKTSLVGLLKGLRQLEYIVRKDDRYLLGSAANAFAMSVISGRGVVQLARPFLRQIARNTGETALLGVQASSDDVAVYVDTVESDNPVRYTVAVGEPRDLYCSAVGKCVLAFYDEQRLAGYLHKHRLVAHTERTITSTSKLIEELKRIRRTGVAFSEDERVLGVSAVAAPVLSRGTELLAVFVVGGPTDRFRANKRTYTNAVTASAKELSRTLGFVESEHFPKPQS